MPKPRLTALFVARIRTSGKYYDTFGMYLRVQSTGRRYWEQRFTIRGRSRTVGIGPYPIVTLKQARDAALENLRIVRSGVDPVVLRRRIKGVPTLADAALTVLALHRKKWTGPRQEGIWIRSLEKHVFPSLGLLPVSDITSADLLSILTPIWNSRPDMARAVRRRVSLVMKWAIANGYRTDNPAGDALTAALPSNHSSRTHFRALHYRDVSAALNLVGASTAYPSTKLLFEFLVLTAARSGEVRGARWDEIDFDAAMWTVPANRTKLRRSHRVPLSTRAISVLRQAHERFGAHDLVFPSKTGRVLSDSTVSKLLRELGVAAVPHGFRSSFRDWCTESGVLREVAEACLAHVIGDATESAYARSDDYDRRIPVMQAWADYLF